MQALHQIETESSTLVGWGVRVLLLTPEEDIKRSKIAEKLAGLGGRVEVEADVFTAIDDAMGYGLFVVECDAYGGLEEGRKILSMLRKSSVEIPAILLSSECPEQMFPSDQNGPIVLRAPLSAVALRVGFEHALRERLVYRAA